MNRVYIKIKYVLGFFIALGALVALTPLFIGVAIAIKTEDGGKVIFRQSRTGAGGKKFYCYKFRSMKRTDVKFNKAKPVIGDANNNLTKVGRFIRKFKIDELPQLINVLRGEMCIIAPRPLLPVYDGDYEDWELVKFEMRPGMTGLGQVYGNGYLSMKDRKFYDVYYTMHASPWLDLRIIVRTVGVILFGEKRFVRRVTESDVRRLKCLVRRRYTVQPDTVAELHTSYGD